MTHRNSSANRDKSKERIDPNTLTSKTKLSQTATSDSSKNPALRRDSTKNNPPLPPQTKPKLKEEDLMTQSRIIQAKNGLQLLKKKMSKKGLLPGKSDSCKEVAEYEEEEELGGTKMEQKESRQMVSEKELRSKPPKEPVRKKAPETSKELPPQEYMNPMEEIPIQPKKDFQKMLQEQLQREQKMQQVQGKVSAIKNPQPHDIDEFGPNEPLYECSVGCGRSFKKDVLPKHEKVCQKVFINKRKAFDSAAQRDLGDEVKVTAPKSKLTSKASMEQTSKTSKVKEQPKQNIPKWKLQSLELRSGLKKAGNKELTSEEKNLEDMQKDALVQCNTCKRRFNEKAAERHIPVCESQAKRMANKTPSTISNNTRKKW